MRVRKRRLQLEDISLQATESFAARQSEANCFPFAWHYHPEAELTLLIKGRGLRFVGDSVEEFTDGDLCLLGADLPHTWYSEPTGERVSSQVIQFLPDAWGKEFLQLPEMARVRELLEKATSGLVIEGQTRQRCREAMAEILRIPAGSAGRVARLLEVLALLSASAEHRVLSTMPAEAEPNRRTQAVLKRVLDRMHNEWEEPPTQAEAAHLAGLSVTGFSRFFRRHLGKPYVQYLNEWRVGRACRLLAESEHSIAQIAFEAGFGNLANFNRRFRAIKRMTPREYRRLSHIATR